MMTKKQRYTMISTALLLLPVAGGAFAAGDAAAGKEKSAQCVSCHGANGEGGSAPKTKIAGIKPAEFSKAIHAYQTGERKNMMMEMFAKKLSDQDIADLAAYFSTK